MKQTCTYMGIITCSLVLLLFGGQAYSSPVCSNPGVDGPATPSGVINSYYPGTGTVSMFSKSITVNIAGKRGAAANRSGGRSRASDKTMPSGPSTVFREAVTTPV